MRIHSNTPLALLFKVAAPQYTDARGVPFTPPAQPAAVPGFGDLLREAFTPPRGARQSAPPPQYTDARGIPFTPPAQPAAVSGLSDVIRGALTPPRGARQVAAAPAPVNASGGPVSQAPTRAPAQGPAAPPAPARRAPQAAAPSSPAVAGYSDPAAGYTAVPLAPTQRSGPSAIQRANMARQLAATSPGFTRAVGRNPFTDEAAAQRFLNVNPNFGRTASGMLERGITSVGGARALARR